MDLFRWSEYFSFLHNGSLLNRGKKGTGFVNFNVHNFCQAARPVILLASVLVVVFRKTVHTFDASLIIQEPPGNGTLGEE